ncbi:MAG: HAD hydrolase-like protein [Thermosphaera sp.]
MSNKAIIFDLDGTLVDSVPLILKCYSEGLSKHGITPVK